MVLMEGSGGGMDVGGVVVIGGMGCGCYGGWWLWGGMGGDGHGGSGGVMVMGGNGG